jgi:hypothetical protein
MGENTVDGSAAALPAELVVGARAEVRGSLRAGVLRATRVTVRSDAENIGREFQVEGLLTSIDTAAGTVTVRGLVISTRRPGLRVDCGSLSPRVGDRVEVRAVLSADRRTLEATRIICR